MSSHRLLHTIELLYRMQLEGCCGGGPEGGGCCFLEAASTRCWRLRSEQSVVGAVLGAGRRGGFSAAISNFWPVEWEGGGGGISGGKWRLAFSLAAQRSRDRTRPRSMLRLRNR